MAALRDNLAKIPDDELVLFRAGLDAEMRRRNIAFSVGGVGERLVIEHFRKTPGLPQLDHSSRGTKNVDANSRHGERYSIKTVCSAKKTGTIYQPAQDQNKQLFEYLLIVRLAEDWSLKSIHQLSWSEFAKVRSWDKRMNAWYVGISSRTLKVATLIFQAAKPGNARRFHQGKAVGADVPDSRARQQGHGTCAGGISTRSQNSGMEKTCTRRS